MRGSKRNPANRTESKARHTGQIGFRAALLILVWAPTGSTGARTGHGVEELTNLNKTKKNAEP